ncbi:hypothetical protein [Shewanella sp. SR44-3]|nr:hypothetical protein [Shewanella sp. SR44-3]MBB1268440.1 hypothetical protein [Shewanella sp. SR44-3]
MTASIRASLILLLAISALLASFYTSGLTQAVIELSAFFILLGLVIRSQK